MSADAKGVKRFEVTVKRPVIVYAETPELAMSRVALQYENCSITNCVELPADGAPVVTDNRKAPSA